MNTPTSKTKPKTAGKTVSARAQAQALLGHVLGDRLTVDEAIAKAPLTGSEPDQRFALLLVMSVLQHLGQLDAVLAQCMDKKLPAKRLAVMNALRLGAAQLLLLDTPPHAAVNESVALVKHGKDVGLSGMVNAVLQKLSRTKPALPAPIANLPAWLRTRWEARYGADTVATMAQVASTRAPLDIHTAIDMPDATRLDAHILRLPPDHPAVEKLPGYDEGAFFVQDVAASYPARLLGDVKELQVLDVCAAPGGKAMQLIAAGAFVTALDRSASRMRTVKANLKRLRMQANTITADAFEWQPSRMYDAILLDAPCTATGTWRRHPEVVHNVGEADIAEMVALQRALLTRAWAWLKPGGRMVYCVCSLEPEEGEQQAEWFLSVTADATIAGDGQSDIPPACITPEGYLRTTPALMHESGGMDGFFATTFIKIAGGR